MESSNMAFCWLSQSKSIAIVPVRGTAGCAGLGGIFACAHARLLKATRLMRANARIVPFITSPQLQVCRFFVGKPIALERRRLHKEILLQIRRSVILFRYPQSFNTRDTLPD